MIEDPEEVAFTRLDTICDGQPDGRTDTGENLSSDRAVGRHK